MTPPDGGRLWRWGVPAAASLAAFAAAAAVAGWLWDPVLSRPVPWLDLAAVAAAFSATLLAGRAIAGPDAPAALTASLGTSRRTEAVLAATVVATGIVLATLQLDGLYAADEWITLRDYIIGQPVAVAAGTYPWPNNHLLHTLLVWAAHQLGGLNPVVLRLPAFLSYCLLLPTLWWFARREYGPAAALFATAFVGASPYFLAYATAMRGYTLLLLMVATALLCGQALVRNPGRKRLWAIWAAAVALGFFTIPLMGFPVAATAAWMLMARWHRFGRDELGSFAARTAAWLAVAAVVVGILYLPVAATAGLDEVWTVLSGHRQSSTFAVRPQALAMHPVVVWRHWHMGVPAWVQGALLAFTLVGAAVAGGTCGRRGTLLLAMCLATGMLLLAVPFRPAARMVSWALMVLMILAGAGAALVLEGAVVRAGARWPGIAAAQGRRALLGSATALVLGALSWWATRPGVRMANLNPSVTCSTPAHWWCTGYNFLPVATVALVDQMRPGDYFAACPAEQQALVDVGAVVAVDQDAGSYALSTNLDEHWPVHRVSTKGWTASEAAQNALFLYESFFTFGHDDRPSCRRDEHPVPMGTLLEARWPDHELVVAFDRGRVYGLNNWAEIP